MFKQHGYDVIIPPVYRARRTIFVRKLDEMILENEEKDLIQEINDKNEWAKVQSLIKINSKNIKITFSDNSMVEKALEKGLLCCNMSVTPDQINRENYIEIVTCFKCYKYNDHTTRECKKPTTLCSCCCSPDHHWRECTSSTKKCLNCGENHHTLASFCSFKKRALEEKKKALADNGSQKQSYAATTINGSVARAVPAATTTIQLQDGMDSKIVSCILMSHFHNLAEPGQFGHYFTRIMAANGLPKIVVPDITDSFKLINALQNAGVVKSTDTTQEQRNTLEKTPAAKKQLFASNESPAKVDDCCAAASSVAATSDPTDAAITPRNMRSRLDIAQSRELATSAVKEQKRCKQERMLAQKQNDLDAQKSKTEHKTPARATRSSSSGSVKITPLRERNMECDGDGRMHSLSALKEDEMKAMEVHYYTTSELNEGNFSGQAPLELWNGTAKTSFIDPFHGFKHPTLNHLTEKDVRYLFSTNKLPFKFVQVFDKLEEGEYSRRRAGPRSPSS